MGLSLLGFVYLGGAGSACKTANTGGSGGSTETTTTTTSTTTGAGGEGGGLPVDTDPGGDLDPVDGDPSLDIVGSGCYSSSGAPWWRVVCDGPWEPPDYYSHFCAIALFDANDLELATFTTELHDGVPSLLVTGVDPSAVTYVVEPNGFRVLLDAPLAPASYQVECGVLKTIDGTFVSDTAGPFACDGGEAPFPP